MINKEVIGYRRQRARETLEDADILMTKEMRESG